MEALEDSNCHSMSDSFSLYERYLRTFNVVDTFLEDNNQPADNNQAILGLSGNIRELDVSIASINHEHSVAVAETAFGSVNSDNNRSYSRDKIPTHSDFCTKVHFPELLDGGSLLNSSITEESNLTDKSDPIDVPVSSEDSKSERSTHPKPVIITSLITMENSNNAVDSVPLFRDVRPSESVFKLPISELTFNGTLKHVQKLKPIVDPISALTSTLACDSDREVYGETKFPSSNSSNFDNSDFLGHKCESNQKSTDASDEKSEESRLEASESTGDSQYEEFPRKEVPVAADDSKSKWNMEQSTSSLETSFDSGVRSPDMFSEDDEEPVLESEQEQNPNFWHFLKDYEAHDKCKMKKMEQTLQGVLPPPSITIIKTDVTEMLRKYYCFLPAFTEDSNITPKVQSTTPTKMTSFIKIPMDVLPENILQETTESFTDKKPEDIQPKAETIVTRLENQVPKMDMKQEADKAESSVTVDEKPKTEQVFRSSISRESKSDCGLNTSAGDKSIQLPMWTETEAKETVWPELLKCRYYGVHYNVTKYSERMEQLARRYGERCVGAETDCSVTVFSGGQSPSSADKRKALRLKMAQAKSPGRRLSHLARRRQAFCSAATIGDRAITTSKMVLIDKNFFPHRKLINSSTERRSPRLRRTPGKRTPGKRTPNRKTPGKRTPIKTPRSGSSSRKKAMRRLLMDPDSLTRSQPAQESSKRALFISPENRKIVPTAPSTSVPLHAMKSKRNLFGSPARQDTNSLDGSRSDMFLKRKRDLDDIDEGRSKVAKSLSFGGDTIGSLKAGPSFSRRASEMFATRNMAELDEHHRKKLLWAVSEALRVHGWRMQSPGFREKASALARLVRRLLTLPAHAAKLNAPQLSTSETLLKIARQYVFAIIKGRTVDECYLDEQARLADTNQKVTGYISAAAYQQRFKPTATASSQIKENTCDGIKQESQKSASKNVLQDKLLNVDTNSNSGLSMLDKAGLYMSNSMPSFEDAAKMRARRQISFDNVDFPKR